ncbi:MAG: ComF family protein [Clostridia bacterium]|nr:ComF family protein [Clostridia bacterium]
MRLIEKFLDKLFIANVENSHTCDLCGKELFSYPDPRLCDECEQSLTKNQAFVCEKCGRATKTEGVCNLCKSEPPTFLKGCSPLVYFGESAALINRFKNGTRALAFYLGEQMSAVVSRLTVFEEPPVLVPVPLAKQKKRERGYNQAEELAKVISRATGYPLKSDLITKVKKDTQQKHLTAKERREKIIGAFHIEDRKFCKGKTLLLVDDILTTGATLSELSRILYNAGAKAVYALTACAVPERD